jgi:hypothetical protein
MAIALILIARATLIYAQTSVSLDRALDVRSSILTQLFPRGCGRRFFISTGTARTCPGISRRS